MFEEFRGSRTVAYVFNSGKPLLPNGGIATTKDKGRRKVNARRASKAYLEKAERVLLALRDCLFLAFKILSKTR